MRINWMKWRYALFAGGITVVMLLGALFVWLILPKIQPSQSVKANPYSLFNYQLNLDPEDAIVVDALRTKYHEPLNKSPMAVYYTREELDNVTETSFARKIRQITDTDAQGFAWYLNDQQELLYFHGKPYTGWFGETGSKWEYYSQGIKKQEIPSQLANQYALTARFAQTVAPSYVPNWLYLDKKQETFEFVYRDFDRYSILHRGTKGLLLSDAPGQERSYFLADTSKFTDIPMEVIEQVVVGDSVWLHVNIGYQELGWIKEDPTYQDYVLTNYSERELIDRVEDVIQRDLAVIQADGPAGASFVDTDTMAQVDVDNQIFFPASTQKIYVLAELYRQYKEGILQPTDMMAMVGDNIVPGAGHINANPEGTEFSLDTLVDMVAIYSDNTAANMLIEAVGGGEVITPQTHKLGMLDTYLEGKYYHNDNGRFQTTPHDAANLFAKLAHHELNGEPWDTMLIEKLRQNTHTFLRTYLWETDSWNKSGLGEPEQNDVAAFVTPYGTYSLAVYTSSWNNHDARYDQVGRLSADVYAVFNEVRADLFHPYDPALGFYR